MNLRQTAEVAALASMASEHVIRADQPISTGTLHAYWKSSQLRLKCWFAGLRTVPTGVNVTTSLSPFHLREQVCLSREILVAELLTRVWSTVLMARDVFRAEDECQQLARHVFLGQSEARREVLKMLADENRLPTRQATVVDRLRRRVERWTDILVAPLVTGYNVTEFAFDEHRAREYGDSHPPFSFSGPSAAVSQLTLVGLSHAIPRTSRTDHARAALDLAVARSVLSALPREAFLHHGPLHTASQHVDEVIRQETPSAPVSGLRFTEFRRRSDNSADDESK